MAETDDGAPRFGGRGNWLSVATTLFFIWAIASFGVRIYAKLRQRELWGHDDTAMAVAALAMIAQVSVTYVAIDNGYGKRPDGGDVVNVDSIEKLLYAGSILYIIAIGVTRGSSAFFIRRLTRIRAQVRAGQIIIYLSGLWVVASILIVALRGDLSAPWRTMDGTNAMLYRWIGVEITGFLIEVALWALAVHMIWQLNMALHKRLIVISAFTGRLLLIGIIIARLVFLAPSHNPEPIIYYSIVAAIITQAAMQFSIIAASLPCFSPLLRPFHSDFVVSNGGAHYDGPTRAKVPDSYLMLSKSKDRTVANASKNTKSLSSSVNNKSNSKSPNQTKQDLRSETDDTFRGEYIDVQCTARLDSSSGEDFSGKTSNEKAQDTEEMVIRQTTTFLVREEKVKSPRK